MRKSFIVVVLLITSLTTLYAQEPQLPSPRQIFEPSVDIVEVHPVVDNANRSLSIYHDRRWVTLPYPDALSEIAYWQPYYYSPAPPRALIIPQSDGNYLFLEPLPWPSDYRAWTANAEAQSIRTATLPCNRSSYDFDEPWGFASLGESTYLCNWITGETSPAFEPEDMEISFYDAAVSPDRRYLALMGTFDIETGGFGRRVYSYEIATQTFRFMGDFLGLYTFVELEYWLTPTVFVISATDPPEWSSRELYVGHVDKVNSLEFGLSELRFFPRPVNDPPGLETMFAALLDGPTSGNCIVEFYDAVTQDYTQYDTGALCELGVPIPDGSYDQLYRAISPNAAVVRYNYFTGERQTLFVGEVETLGAIAPDGRHGLIALDSSGYVDTDQDPASFFGFELEPAEYVVMDLQNGAILRRVPADVQWWSPIQLFNQTQLFTLDENRVEITDLPGNVIFAYSHGLLLRTSGDELLTFNPETDEVMTAGSVPVGYDIYAMTLESGITRIAFFEPDENLPTITIDVRLP